MKLFAARPKDLLDAESISIRQTDKLDKARILRHLAALSELKEDPAILTRAQKILESHV